MDDSRAGEQSNREKGAQSYKLAQMPSNFQRVLSLSNIIAGILYPAGKWLNRLNVVDRWFYFSPI